MFNKNHKNRKLVISQSELERQDKIFKRADIASVACFVAAFGCLFVTGGMENPMDGTGFIVSGAGLSAVGVYLSRIAERAGNNAYRIDKLLRERAAYRKELKDKNRYTEDNSSGRKNSQVYDYEKDDM